MKIWFTRTLALFFVLSIVASPQIAYMATDEAAPVDIGQASNSDDLDGVPGELGSLDDGTSTPDDAENEEEENQGNDPNPGIEDSGDENLGGSDDQTSDNQDAGDEESGDTGTVTGPTNDIDIATPDEPLNQPDAGKSSGDDVGDIEGHDGKSDHFQVQSLVLEPDTFYVPIPTYDYATGLLTVSVEFHDGFVASADGRTDSFVIEYDTNYLSLVNPSPLPELNGVPDSTVSVDPVAGVITITFNEYFAVYDSPFTASASLSGTVENELCLPAPEPYQVESSIWFTTPHENRQMLVPGKECPASNDPVIGFVDYDEVTGQLVIVMLLADQPIAGQQVTLSYPADKILMNPGPFDVMGLSEDRQREYVIGSATASDGLITITLTDPPLDAEFIPIGFALVDGWLTSADCSDVTGTEFVEIGDLLFVTNLGLEFEVDVPGVLCNADPASKTGEWTTDNEGNAAIAWTIDTGDVFGYTWADDYAYGSGFLFNCEEDSFSVEVISGAFEHETNFCDSEKFGIDFWSVNEDPYRAVITFTTPLDPEITPTSYINCADISVQFGEEEQQILQAQATNGLGGRPCYELFPENEGGDFISVDVDKATAKPGDTLTYTIQVTTSADEWSSITVTDPFPEGFAPDPASITCSVDPITFMADPCATYADGVLTVHAWPEQLTEEGDYPFHYYVGGPVTITLTVSGIVTAEPGSTIVNQACSQRRVWFGFQLTSMGDPTIVGGGVICDSASTLVLQADEPDPDPTETPSPPATPDPTGTPDPTVPVDPVDPSPEPTDPATPGASPTTPADPDPTATSAVTGLPETGSGSAASAMLISALAASLLMAVAFGIRIRSPRA